MRFTVNLYINNKSRINRFIFKDAVFVPPCVSTQAPEHPCYRSLCMQTIIKHVINYCCSSVSIRVAALWDFNSNITVSENITVLHILYTNIIRIRISIGVSFSIIITYKTLKWVKTEGFFFVWTKLYKNITCMKTDCFHTRVNSETGIPSDPIPFILTLCWQGLMILLETKVFSVFFFITAQYSD